MLFIQDISTVDGISTDNGTSYGAVCNGNETKLTDCLIDFRFCSASSDQASVRCATGILIYCSSGNQLIF